MDLVLGSPGIIFGLLSFGVLYHVLQSMTANSIRTGWGEWVPDWLLNKLTDWGKVEPESKLSRTNKRKEEREK